MSKIIDNNEEKRSSLAKVVITITGNQVVLIESRNKL